jgi:hypothetical protein
MYEHTRKIRDFVSEPRNCRLLMDNQDSWLQLCSSLDVLEDAELAVAAYHPDQVSSDGEKYLTLYGLLQALFLQQDALFNMCESLSIPERIQKHPKLLKIREIRNISTGYPTKRDRARPISYHFISRATLGPDGFQLLSTDASGRREFTYISLRELAEEQNSYIGEILGDVVAELEARTKLHREEFRHEKLADIFPNTLSYQFEKLFASARGEEPIQLGLWALSELQTMLHLFSERLKARGIALETYDSIKSTYERLKYPIGELQTFLEERTSPKRTTINEATAHIYSFFVEAQVRELMRIADEIDEEYLQGSNQP